jgi:hypothetical protein
VTELLGLNHTLCSTFHAYLPNSDRSGEGYRGSHLLSPGLSSQLTNNVLACLPRPFNSTQNSLESASNQVHGDISSVIVRPETLILSRRSPSQPAITETLKVPSTKSLRHLEFGYVAVVRLIVSPRIYFFEVAVCRICVRFRGNWRRSHQCRLSTARVFGHRAGCWGGDFLECALILI